jgi:hypothetical protein
VHDFVDKELRPRPPRDHLELSPQENICDVYLSFTLPSLSLIKDATVGSAKFRGAGVRTPRIEGRENHTG